LQADSVLEKLIMSLELKQTIFYYQTTIFLGRTLMFSFDFGLPMLLVVLLIAISWLSFFSVVFFG